MADTKEATIADDSVVQLSPKTTNDSKPFVGQWNELISTTNWEKGEIICQWRESLKDNKAAASQITDEAWSQLVGGVTPQHVGRLRRTYERFGHVYKEYDGVFWSHFYASLDWDDAEMWLEGAVQNKWSVSGMRKQRWETLGKVGDEPVAGEIVSTEVAEETQSLSLAENTRQNDRDYVEGPVHEGPDWGDDEKNGKSSSASEFNDDEIESGISSPKSTARSFESFKDLPEDLMDAASAFKLAIIEHKSNDWEEVSQSDVTDLLDSLKQLALN